MIQDKSVDATQVQASSIVSLDTCNLPTDVIIVESNGIFMPSVLTFVLLHLMLQIYLIHQVLS